MLKTNNTSFITTQNKNTTNKTESQTILSYWQNHIATSAMVSAATSVPHKNICRYKKDLEKQGLLFELYRCNCVVTKCKAWYITASKDLYLKHKNTN